MAAPVLPAERPGTDAPTPRRGRVTAGRLALVVAAISVVEQARVLWSFGLRYATEDAALLWYAARELGRGQVHQPSFYGQSYGTVVEAVPALVVGLLTPLDRPAAQAVTTALLAAATSGLVAFACWRRGRTALAVAALAAPAVLSVEYRVLAAAPRGFALALTLAAAAGLVLTGRDDPRPRDVLGFAALGGLAVAWDASTLLVVAPLAVWAALQYRRRPHLAALAAGAVPGGVWAAATALYYRRHPDENLYERGGFGVRLDVLRHNLRRLGELLAAYRPELVRWWVLPLLAVAALLAVLAVRGWRARSLPVLAATTCLAVLLVAAAATPKSLNSNEQVHLGASRFFLPLPVAAVLLLLLTSRPSRPSRPSGPGGDGGTAAGAAPGSAGGRPAPAAAVVVAGLAALSVAASLPLLDGRLDDLVATSRAAAEGVDLRDVAEVEDRCARLAAAAAAAGTDLVVFRTDLVATYACPPLTGGAVETLYPAFDRRVWRLRDELARSRTAVVVADVPDGWCDRLATDAGDCRPVPDAALRAAVLRAPSASTLLLLRRAGLPIQSFRADPALLAPLVCETPFPPEGGDPPAPDPSADGTLGGLVTVELDGQEFDGRTPRRAAVTVLNTGTATWPAEDTPLGRVRLGVHLLDEHGAVVRLDYLHVPLGRRLYKTTAPGETVRLTAEIPSPPAGRYLLEFDLVSEGRAWFASHGSPTVRIPVESRCAPDRW